MNVSRFSKYISIMGLASLSLAQSSFAQYPAFEGIRGLSIVEGADGSGSPRTLIKAVKDPSSFDLIPCNGPTDSKCVDKQASAAAYLLPCSSENTIGCTIEVYAISSTGEKLPAKFIRSVGDNPVVDFGETRNLRLPVGAGVGGLWQIPGLNHGGGTDIYSVQNRIAGWTERTMRDSTFYFDSVQLQISAVTSVDGPFETPYAETSSGTVGYGGYSLVDCVMTEQGKCYKRETLPPGYRFGIKVRLPNALNGWYHGRLSKPEFVIKSSNAIASGTYEYQVEADPVKVPIMTKIIQQDSWSQEFYNFVKDQWPMSNGGALLLPGNAGKLPLKLSQLFLPMIGDKATGTGDFWVIKSLTSWKDGKTDETVDPITRTCNAGDLNVSGIVTTNAMVYTQGPPVYNKTEASLDYTVLSPHFDENGLENVGTYDLLINSKVARCIYGFSSAPIKAQIEVVGDDGATKIATTVLGEKGPWLYLSANGFTFSQPTVRVRITQEKVVAESKPVTEATKKSLVSAAKPATQKSITCSNGKTTKKITGASPKCPAGYKKK